MESKSLNRPGLLLLALAVVLLSAAPMSSAFSSESLSLRVYSDGYVHVTQVLSVDQKATSVQVPILSPAVTSLVATDQNGSPLSYGFAPGGANVTVYTVGATAVTVRYDTNGLTSKNGTVWTLRFTARYNSTVILPQLSTLTSVSGTPYSINETNMSPEVSISPGTWRISYGVSLGSITANTTATTPAGGGSQGGSGGPPALELEEAGALLAALVAGGIPFWWWRSRRIGPLGGDLRPDDVQVLNFIQEKGGRVLEPEIRTRFALPKTSAWRQIKRLERLGYVKVTKIGSQNQIEILRDRNQAT